MKVYSWKTLLVTILVGGGVLIYKIKDIMAGEMSEILFMMFWGYLIIKGLWVSFTEEGSQVDKRNEAINKTVFNKLFGKWAFIVQMGGFILILLAGVIIKLIPSQKWLSFFLFMGGLVYYIVIGILVRKPMKEERRKYF